MRLCRISEGAMGATEYKPPQNVRTLMADFYCLDLLRQGAKHTESHRTSELAYELDYTEGVLLKHLRSHLLDKVGFSIASELRHIYDAAMLVNMDDPLVESSREPVHPRERREPPCTVCGYPESNCVCDEGGVCDNCGGNPDECSCCEVCDNNPCQCCDTCHEAPENCTCCRNCGQPSSECECCPDCGQSPDYCECYARRRSAKYRDGEDDKTWWLNNFMPEEASTLLKDSADLGVRPNRQSAAPYYRNYAVAGVKAFADGDYFSWRDQYGGAPWQTSCELWLALDQAQSPTEIRMAADRIYQQQHNTGSLLNKNEEYKGPWLRQMLNLKYVANDPEALLPLGSPYLRRLAGYVLQNRHGRPYDADKGGPPTTSVERRLLYPAAQALRPLLAHGVYEITYGARQVGNTREVVYFKVRNGDRPPLLGFIQLVVNQSPEGKKYNAYQVCRRIQNPGGWESIRTSDTTQDPTKLTQLVARFFGINHTQPKTWNQALRQVGTQAPGGSYWKPTSESRSRS